MYDILLDKEKYINAIYNNKDYFESYVTRSIYNSNAIEGSTLSYYDTYQIVFDTSSNVPLKNIKPRELYEAINLKYAINYMFVNIEKDVDSSYICDLGILVNKNINEASGYRTSQVFIKGAEHIPPNASDVPRLINELLYTSFKGNDFFTNLAEFHIRYERIHPFVDGNGRTGRILLNKFALDNNFPMFVIPLEDRAEYMNYLADYNIEGLASLFNKLIGIELNKMEEYNIKIDNILFDSNNKNKSI